MGADGALGRCPEQFEASGILRDGGFDVVTVPDDIFPSLTDPGLRLRIRHDPADESDTIALQVPLEWDDFFRIVNIGVVDGWDDVYAACLDVVDL